MLSSDEIWEAIEPYIGDLKRKGIGSSDPYPANFLIWLALQLPENPTIVEVGTLVGGTARELGRVAEAKGGKVFCIDNKDGWRDYHTDHWIHNQKEAGVDHLVTLIEGVSWESVDKIDGQIDMVFIDADHEYSAVRKDIIAWAPKVKLGGLLVGDDYMLPGCIRAVPELVPGYEHYNRIWYKTVDEELLEHIKNNA